MRLLYLLLMLVVSVSCDHHEEGCPHECDCFDTTLKCHMPALRALQGGLFPENTTTLDLSGNNILNILPSSLQPLHYLEELKVEGNKIYFLEEDAFQGQETLKKLSLEDNNIHFIEEDVLSPLTNLEELDLAQNQINKLPKFKYNKKLKSLMLSQNKLTEIPLGGLTDLNNLEKLCLKKNELKSLKRDAFPDNLSKMVALNLVGNRLSDVPQVLKEMTNLQNLSLCYNPLKLIDPEDFFPLTELKMLYMSGVGITEFKSYMNWIPKLKILGLSKNKITAEKLQDLNFQQLEELLLNLNPLGALLGESFLGTPDVKILELKSAKIKAIDYQAFKPLQRMRELYLQDNLLTSVPSFNSNLNLEKLDLSQNNITQISRSSFRTLTKLKYLDLSNNSISQFSNLAFVGSVALETLDLSSNHFTRIPSVVGELLQQLKHLNVSDNLITSINKEDFQGLSQLQVLNLQGNELKQLSSGIFSQLTNLQVLKLCRNELSSLAGQAFTGLSNLEELTLDKNKFTSLGSSMFEQTTKVRIISFKHNQLKFIDNTTFHQLSQLEELWLLYNNLTEMPDLTKNTKLKVVGLCGNAIMSLPNGKFCPKSKITHVMFRAMNLTEINAEVFPSLDTIEYLHLASNQLQHVPRFIYKMTSLEVLRLSDNPITFLSAREFEGMSNLRELRLDNMKVTSSDITEFFPALPALRLLYLSGNPWDCNCNMQWYALGIDGARARITTEDQEDMKCAGPPRVLGKKFNYLRLGDFRHCLPLQVRFVFETAAVISLPIINKLSHGESKAYNKVTYLPLHGGKESMLRAEQRDLRLQNLSPDTEYLICSRIVVPRSHLNRRHALDREHDHPLSLDGAAVPMSNRPDTEICAKFKTRAGDSVPKLHAHNKIILHRHSMVIVYAVIGGAAAFALLLTIILTAVWCRRNHQHMSESMAPFGNITEDSIGTNKSGCNNDNQSQSSNRVVEEKGVSNGKTIEMVAGDNKGTDNKACDVSNENQIRTKL